jgi:hypothetical protein
MKPRIAPARHLAVAALVVLLAVASWFKPLDAAAVGHVDQGMKAAFVSFATARAINGAISLVQSMQVGVGASVNPGELLDPVNDLVEQFSNLMLAATVAFGVQKVLLAMGVHAALPVLLTCVAGVWLALTLSSRPVPRWLGQVVVVLLIVRFAVPVATVGTDLLARAFLAPTYEAAQTSLGQLVGAPSADGQRAAGADTKESWSEWARRWSSKATDVSAQVERFGAAAGRIAEHVTDLIVVFLLQTLVFPVALLWIVYRSAVMLLRPG